MSFKLTITSPPNIVSVTGGRIEASVTAGRFVWGEGRFRSVHLIEDHEGTAEKIFADAATLGHEQASQAAGTRTAPYGNRAITEYQQEELVALIQQLIDQGRVQTQDTLLDVVLDELRLPGRTPKRVEIIERAAIQAGWRASVTATQRTIDHDPQYLDVVHWAQANRYEIQAETKIPAHVIFQYNLAHPDQPYRPRANR